MCGVCKRLLSIISFCLLWVANVFGQPKCKIEFYSTEQGLSHQRITTMIKDHEGFMWFGSWDGINRFDGHSFVSYKSSPADKYQLGNNRIDRIVEDQSGHLWVQAADRQIYRFDKKDHQFLPLSTIISSQNKPKTAFTNIPLAADGYVWLQSVNEGVFCVSQTAFSKERVLHFQKEGTDEYKLPSNAITFVNEDKEHRVWIGTSEGLCCLTQSAGIYTNSKIVPADFDGMYFTKSTEDADRLYFGTKNGDLIIFEKKSKTFTRRQIATGRINSLFRSKKRDVVYACSSVGEVVTVNLTNQQVTTANYHPVDSISSPYEDGSGALWIRPRKEGAIRFDPQNNSFQLFLPKAGTSNNGNFFRIVEDYNGTIWVNMNGGGFGYFNPVTKKLESSLVTTDGTNYQWGVN